jgi:hypothetical protein
MGTPLLTHWLSVYCFVVNQLQNTTPNNSFTVVCICGFWELVVVHIQGCWWLVLDITSQWMPLHHFSDSQILTFRHHVTIYKHTHITADLYIWTTVFRPTQYTFTWWGGGGMISETLHFNCKLMWLVTQINFITFRHCESFKGLCYIKLLRHFETSQLTAQGNLQLIALDCK